MEQQTLDKEVERLTAVVFRMEDMRISTRQLTDQMQLDTALQMRHILENGKSIVPRVSDFYSLFTPSANCPPRRVPPARWKKSDRPRTGLPHMPLLPIPLGRSLAHPPIPEPHTPSDATSEPFQSCPAPMGFQGR